MKILALVPAIFNTTPGQRFRIEKWVEHLKTSGIEVTFSPFENRKLREVLYKPGFVLTKGILVFQAFLKKILEIPKWRQFDAVYIYREAAYVGPPFLEWIIFMMGIPIIYDFDDAIWLQDASSKNRNWNWLRCSWKTAWICRISAAVIVGNAYLADYAKKYNQKVHIVPTVIDTHYHTPRKFPTIDKNHTVIIGWTGSLTTLPYLQQVHHVLQILKQRYAIVFHVIGADHYSIKDVPTVAKPWNAETEIKELQAFDIGIMPLTDDCWSQGKCGFKILQYMATGIPAVASDVGMNKKIIQEGVNGYLVSSENQWIEKLSKLIEDAALRKQMGAEGRRMIEETFSLVQWLPAISNILKDAAKK